jgi:hypothetical protein
MAPVAREPLPEEKLLGGLAKGWAYLAYTIKQLIILFPNLWAGAEMARRKEEKRKSQEQQDPKKVDDGRKLFVEASNCDVDEGHGGKISAADEGELQLVVGYFEGLTWDDLIQEATSSDVESD